MCEVNGWYRCEPVHLRYLLTALNIWPQPNPGAWIPPRSVAEPSQEPRQDCHACSVGVEEGTKATQSECLGGLVMQKRSAGLCINVLPLRTMTQTYPPHRHIGLCDIKVKGKYSGQSR